MNGNIDGDRESVRQARAEGAARPIGSDATPRVGPRAEDARRMTPGLGTAPTGVPSVVPDPEPPLAAESEPGRTTAWAVIGAVVLALGLIALPFFVFSLLVAAPVALVMIAIAAVLVMFARRR